LTALRLGALAKNDLAQAGAWYAEQAPGLELRFATAVEAMLGQLEAFPESHPVVYRDVRRAHLRTFPYAVLYHRRGDAWFVLGVVHQARDPRVWQRRR